MAAKYYANYLPKDFDNFDCLKLAPGIYLILLFVLRAYIVWIMSVTNMRDHVGIIQWIFPQTSLFYLNLASGVIGLYIVFVLSLRRPNAANWVRASWQKCHVLLVAALIFDLLVTVLGYFVWHLQSITWLLAHGGVVVIAIAYIMHSKRFAINLAEFPEELPKP